MGIEILCCGENAVKQGRSIELAMELAELAMELAIELPQSRQREGLVIFQFLEISRHTVCYPYWVGVGSFCSPCEAQHGMAAVQQPRG
jgi:hypothetical protein